MNLATRWCLVAAAALVVGGCSDEATQSNDEVTATSAAVECAIREPSFVSSFEAIEPGMLAVRLLPNDASDLDIADQVVRALESVRVGVGVDEFFTPQGNDALANGPTIFDTTEPDADCTSEFEIIVGAGPRSESLVFAEVRLLDPVCEVARIRLVLRSPTWQIDGIEAAGPEQLDGICPAR